MSLIEEYKKLSEILNVPAANTSFTPFIQDYRDEIVESSTTQQYDLADTARYNYRPADFLRAKKIPVSIEWILLWINNMPSKTYFVDITEIKVPDITYIIRLRDKWLNDESNKLNATSSIPL